MGVGAGVSVGVGAGDSVGVDEGVGITLGFGTAGIFTPLFQTSFFPDLMQVNFFPRFVEVAPAFGQLPPAFTAASEFDVANIGMEMATEIIRISHGRLILTMLDRTLNEGNSQGFLFSPTRLKELEPFNCYWHLVGAL